MTTIRYFIPEDGDEELHPNVFLAPKPRQPGAPPTLQSVRDAFPLPGHYHFRFKSPLFPGADREKGAMAVWMDVTKDQQPVPTWKNNIVAKVTRLNMEEEDDDDDDDFGHHHHHHNVHTPASAPAAAHHSRAPSSTGSGDHLDMLFDGPSPQPPPQQHQATPPNLFDAQPPPSAPSTGGSLLDFGAPAPSPAVHSDFLGMTHQAPPPPQQQQYQQPPQPPQQQRPPQQSFNSYAKQAQPFGDLGGWT